MFVYCVSFTYIRYTARWKQLQRGDENLETSCDTLLHSRGTAALGPRFLCTGYRLTREKGVYFVMCLYVEYS